MPRRSIHSFVAEHMSADERKRTSEDTTDTWAEDNARLRADALSTIVDDKAVRAWMLRNLTHDMVQEIGYALDTYLWKDFVVVPGKLVASYVIPHKAETDPLDGGDWHHHVDIHWRLLGKYDAVQTIRMSCSWSDADGYHEHKVLEQSITGCGDDKNVCGGKLVSCISRAAYAMSVTGPPSCSSSSEARPGAHPDWDINPFGELCSFFRELVYHLPYDSAYNAHGVRKAKSLTTETST